MTSAHDDVDDDDKNAFHSKTNQFNPFQNQSFSRMKNEKSGQ